MIINLAPYAGGLGDALLFSTLPELYALRGDKVYICNTPACRNPEVRELVWGCNPFVSGFTNEQPNVIGGSVFLKENQKYNQIFYYKHMRSSIEAIEKLHGFENTDHLQCPKIYYKPKFLPDWRNKVVFDPFSHSQEITLNILEDFTQWICRWNNYNIHDMIILSSRYSGNHGGGLLQYNKGYFVKDIFEYCDIMNSCKAFLVSESGGQVLASALRANNPNINVFGLQTTKSVNNRYFLMPNILVYVTGRMTDDFKEDLV